MLKRDINVRTILAHQPLFLKLNDDELDTLASQSVLRRVSRNEILFNRGDDANYLWIVVLGRVKLALSSPSGDEKILAIINAGKSFGEAVLFLHKPYPVMAECLEEGMVVQVEAASLFEAVRKSPEFAFRMLAGMSLRLHELVSDVETYSMRSSVARLAKYLLTLIDEGDQSPISIELPVAKAVLASRLSVTPETISRTLGTLAQRGLVKAQGKQLEILDIAGLKDCAELH